MAERRRERRETMRRILEERARALARPLVEQEPSDAVGMVVMAVGPERYGVETQSVREVLVGTEPVPVPGTPGFWSGIVNVRGTLYPVLDLRRYLSLPDAGAEQALGTVVLVSGASLTVGIAVDDVPEVRRVRAGAIGPALASDGDGAAGVVRGLTDDLLTVLDIEALLADSALIVREEPA